jgi:hypothetical protein
VQLTYLDTVPIVRQAEGVSKVPIQIEIKSTCDTCGTPARRPDELRTACRLCDSANNEEFERMEDEIVSLKKRISDLEAEKA